MTLADKVPDRESVPVGVTARETLVGHVKEGEVLLLLHDVADFLPLLLRRVDTGRVVRTGVQEDDGLVRCSLDVCNHAFKVQADSLLVVVLVLLHFQPGVLEDGRVVPPRRGGQVDGLGVRVVAREEGSTDAEGTCSRDGLGDGDAVLGDRLAVSAVGELGGVGGKVGESSDGEVLLVAL